MIVNTLFGTEEVESKDCYSCSKEKPLTEFHYRNHTKDGKLVYFNICKDCKGLHDQAKRIHQRSHPKPDKYYECLICEGTEEIIEDKFGQHGKNGHKPMSLWQMDLDHKNNYAFRGYLCAHCNTMISRAHDNPEVLRKGAEYLEKNKIY